MIKLSAVKSIAVLHANAVGDFVFILPFLETLRRAAPQAQITFIGTEWHNHFAAKRFAYVDEFVAIKHFDDDFEWTHNEQNAILPEKSFDLLFQAHNGSEYANRVAKNIHAGYKIGYVSDDVSNDLDLGIPFVHYVNEITRHLELLRVLGVSDYSIVPNLPVIQDDIDEVRHLALFDRLDVPKIAIIHPGAGSIRRTWLPERYSEIADFMADKGYRVLLTGSRDELNIVRKVARGMKNHADNIAGMLSVGGLAALFTKAAIVITNDTGPLHVARCIGPRTVGLYALPYSLHSLPLMAHKDRSIISNITMCSKCGADLLTHWDIQRNAMPSVSCKHQVSFLTDITVDRVIHAIDSFDL